MRSFNVTRGFFLVFILLTVVTSDVFARPGTDPSTSDVSTTARPTTAIVRRLEQLKDMEESTLKGWYELVKKFLHLIKSDNETLPLIIDYVEGKEHFHLPDSLLTLAKMNTAFLVLVGIGITYVVAMLFSGLFFLCCRYCGRCGAKDSQRQRSSLGCWRTTHKFCLVVMIAFLVVPFICMCIINEHMKQSLPSAKSNATEVFTILIDYANETQDEISRFAKKMEEPNSDEKLHSLFQAKFASPLKEAISELLSEERLDEIKSIVNWLIAIKENYTEVTDTTSLSSAMQELKDKIGNIRQLIGNYCPDSNSELCSYDFKPLPVERINIEHDMARIENEFEKLVKYSDLQDVVDKIQNNTMLSDVFSEKSKDLRKLADDLKPQRKEEFEKIVKKINLTIDEIKLNLGYAKKTVDNALVETDSYEIYRWWAMFGIALLLIIPVVFLVLGLICGCCGYEKDRHPTKRSSVSNCGGCCLILAVYCFFLIASILMLLTVGLFVAGGNLEIFVCAPLYQDELTILDQVKERVAALQTDDLKNIVPSKILKECQEDQPIFQVLDLPALASDNTTLSEHIRAKLEASDISPGLRKTIYQKTDEIKKYFDNFTEALNLTEMKDFPELLQSTSKNTKATISEFSDVVKSSLGKDGSDPERLEELNKFVSQLLRDINDWEMKLNNLSSTLKHISEEADFYKDKIRQLREDLNEIEQKLPVMVEKHLLQFTVGYVEDIVQKFKSSIGRCNPIWVSFDTARTVVCQFVVNPVNGYWFGLGWSLLFIIPTIIFAVKLSRHYIKMKYDDDIYIHDSGEAVPLEEMNRSKPFSYTNPGGGWMPHNYVVHPASGNQARQFNYK